MSKRPLLLAIVGLLGLGAAVAVSTALTVAGDGTDPRCPDEAYGCATFRPGEAVRVGLLVTRAGADDATAVAARRGARLAIEAHGPRLAGRPLDLLVQTPECSARGAARGARELASDPPFEPPVLAVVGMTCRAALQPAVQILSDSGVAYVTATPGDVAFTDPPRSFLARPPVGEPDRRFRRLYRARYG
ncbi:MAG TPA: ABC transporter substrate-binding protein, partial [Actinomycetota bacterium]|nr:ABC transporter substrate-binding protein [Actinomycetota bacterium]